MANVDATRITPEDWPDAEDETWEFKSSQCTEKEIKAKLPKSVSGFANSGGGCFLWGVDDDGNPDGGVPAQVGRQPIRDWLDKIVAHVQPTPAYRIAMIEATDGRGRFDSDRAVVAIAIDGSSGGPHQSSDHKYYVRAGAHTEPASHAIVEALWARRQTDKPLLNFALMRGEHVETLVLCNVTETPAYDVTVTGSIIEHQWKNPANQDEGVNEKKYEINRKANFLSPPAYLSLEGLYLVIPKPTCRVDIEATYFDLAKNQYSERYQGFTSDLVRMPQSLGAYVAQQDQKLEATVRDLQLGIPVV